MLTIGRPVAAAYRAARLVACVRRSRFSPCSRRAPPTRPRRPRPRPRRPRPRRSSRPRSPRLLPLPLPLRLPLPLAIHRGGDARHARSARRRRHEPRPRDRRAASRSPSVSGRYAAAGARRELPGPRQPRRAIQGQRREEAAAAHRARRRRPGRRAAVDGAAVPGDREGRLSLGPRRQRRQGDGRVHRRHRARDGAHATRPLAGRHLRADGGRGGGGLCRGPWLAKNRKDLLDAEIALNEGAGTRLDDEGESRHRGRPRRGREDVPELRFVVRGKGGHSSIPPTDSDPVLTLSRALVKVGEFRFPARVMAASTRRAGCRREAREATHRGRRGAGRRDRQGERRGRAGSREGPCRQCTPADHLRRDAAAGLAAGQRPADDRPRPRSTAASCPTRRASTRSRPFSASSASRRSRSRPSATSGTARTRRPTARSPRRCSKRGGSHLAGRGRRVHHQHRRDRLEAPSRHRHPRLRRERLADLAGRRCWRAASATAPTSAGPRGGSATAPACCASSPTSSRAGGASGIRWRRGLTLHGQALPVSGPCPKPSPTPFRRRSARSFTW